MIAWRCPSLLALGLLGSLACNQGGQGGQAESPASVPEQAAEATAEADAAVLLLAAQAALALEAEIIAEALVAEEAEAAAATQAEREREPDVIYVPTPEPVVDRMLELAAVQEDDVVYDLGCGDGRIVITAAERYGVKAWGFDIDPVRVAEARENARVAGVEHLVTIEQKDIFTLDLSAASVVTLYLLPELNVRLIPQLEKLKPGSRVVSHDFGMEGVTPRAHETLNLGARDIHQIFLWHTPLSPVPEQSQPAPERGAPAPAPERGEPVGTPEQSERAPAPERTEPAPTPSR
ncbi:MAG TPA: methyltransferase domain-containing protein [Polyangiaceae bacterium]|nr:methyltransferase domain-containing protein [Polyangiaceae bacterium]